jgi:DNA-binding CsgD family transcriptional regulator
VVDGDLTAYWLNSSAEALMDKDDSLLHRNGRIVPRDRRLESEFRIFVTSATAAVSAQCISDVDTGGRILLTATRLPSPWEHLIGVTLQQAGDDLDIQMADLHQAFGFTRTEARVAYHLFCGRTADETAEDLEVSLDTVRTHIKHVYAKLEVSSREAFFHKLTPFVISMS